MKVGDRVELRRQSEAVRVVEVSVKPFVTSIIPDKQHFPFIPSINCLSGLFEFVIILNNMLT